MKKVISSIAGLVLVVGLCGCSITKEQVQVVAQQAGVFAAVSWIATDNPSTDAVVVVSYVVRVIQDKSKDITAGKTYTEAVYPEVVKVIDANIKPQYGPIAKVAALSFMGSIDLMFALHPEWRTDQDTALSVVTAFTSGVTQGLALKADHPAVLQARRTAVMRMQAK